MILADTLTLASRIKPDLLIDFATLTGSMVSALGDRYSGVISNSPKLSSLAVEAGNEVGERVCAFPFDDDYDEDLKSCIADIKQCSLDNEADHILAARFLNHFVEKNIPWLHVDLSSSSKKGGLGAIASDVNGFGVSLGLQIIKKAILKQS
jgi:leucyl aminopeptidase